MRQKAGNIAIIPYSDFNKHNDNSAKKTNQCLGTIGATMIVS